MSAPKKLSYSPQGEGAQARGLGYLHAWPWEGVLLMLGASSGQG